MDLRRHKQRGRAVGRRVIHPSTPPYEALHDEAVALVRRHKERGRALPVLVLQLLPDFSAQQELHHGGVALEAGTVQARPPAAVRVGNVGAARLLA